MCFIWGINFDSSSVLILPQYVNQSQRAKACAARGMRSRGLEQQRQKRNSVVVPAATRTHVRSFRGGRGAFRAHKQSAKKNQNSARLYSLLTADLFVIRKQVIVLAFCPDKQMIIFFATTVLSTGHYF